MGFGTRKAEAPTTGDGVWLRNFQSGETQIRFIEEMDDWIHFKEHYNVEKHWFPCTQDGECPGCSSEIESVRKKSTKYATNVYLPKTSEVRPYKIPVSLANRLETRAERNGGTIVSRDYVVIKTGSGLDTDYDVDQESKYDAPLSEYRKAAFDIETLLVERFEEVINPKQPDDDDPVEKKADAKKDEPTESREERRARLAKEEEQAKGSTEEPPFDSASEQTVTLNEEAVRSMSLRELVKLADDAGIEIDEDMKKSEIADFLISKLG